MPSPTRFDDAVTKWRSKTQAHMVASCIHQIPVLEPVPPPPVHPELKSPQMEQHLQTSAYMPAGSGNNHLTTAAPQQPEQPQREENRRAAAPHSDPPSKALPDPTEIPMPPSPDLGRVITTAYPQGSLSPGDEFVRLRSSLKEAQSTLDAMVQRCRDEIGDTLSNSPLEVLEELLKRYRQLSAEADGVKARISAADHAQGMATVIANTEARQRSAEMKREMEREILEREKAMALEMAAVREQFATQQQQLVQQLRGERAKNMELNDANIALKEDHQTRKLQHDREMLAEKEMCEQQVSEARALLPVLQLQLEEQQQREQSLRDEHARAQATVASGLETDLRTHLESRVAQLTTALETQLAQSKQELEAAHQAEQRYKQRIAQLEKESSIIQETAFAAHRDAVQTGVEELSRQLQTENGLRAKVDRLQAELDRCQRSNTSTQMCRERDAFSAAISFEESHSSQLEEEVQNYREALHEANQLLKQHMCENESIKAQIIQEKQLRESAELRVAALSRELEGERSVGVSLFKERMREHSQSAVSQFKQHTEQSSPSTENVLRAEIASLRVAMAEGRHSLAAVENTQDTRELRAGSMTPNPTSPMNYSDALKMRHASQLSPSESPGALTEHLGEPHISESDMPDGSNYSMELMRRRGGDIVDKQVTGSSTNENKLVAALNAHRTDIDTAVSGILGQHADQSSWRQQADLQLAEAMRNQISYISTQTGTRHRGEVGPEQTHAANLQELPSMATTYAADCDSPESSLRSNKLSNLQSIEEQARAILEEQDGATTRLVVK